MDEALRDFLTESFAQALAVQRALSAAQTVPAHSRAFVEALQIARIVRNSAGFFSLSHIEAAAARLEQAVVWSGGAKTGRSEPDEVHFALSEMICAMEAAAADSGVGSAQATACRGKGEQAPTKEKSSSASTRTIHQAVVDSSVFGDHFADIAERVRRTSPAAGREFELTVIGRATPMEPNIVGRVNATIDAVLEDLTRLTSSGSPSASSAPPTRIVLCASAGVRSTTLEALISLGDALETSVVPSFSATTRAARTAAASFETSVEMGNWTLIAQFPHVQTKRRILLVSSGPQRYALPLEAVERIIDPSSSPTARPDPSARGGPTIDLFGLAAEISAPRQAECLRPLVVRIFADFGGYDLRVDEVFGLEQVEWEMGSAGQSWAGIFAGAARLGCGERVPLLDPVAARRRAVVCGEAHS